MINIMKQGTGMTLFYIQKSLKTYNILSNYSTLTHLFLSRGIRFPDQSFYSCQMFFVRQPKIFGLQIIFPGQQLSKAAIFVSLEKEQQIRANNLRNNLRPKLAQE